MISNKKILFVNSLYAPFINGGAEVILQQQAEAFLSKGNDVTVLSTQKRKGISYDLINGIKVIRVGIKNIYWPFDNKRRNKFEKILWHLFDKNNIFSKHSIKGILKKVNPDVVICHNLAGLSISTWDAIASTNTPIIQVLHDHYLLCPQVSMFKHQGMCQKQCSSCKILRSGFIEKSQKIDAVVGVSNYILNRLCIEKYFSDSKKFVINNARSLPEITRSVFWNGDGTLKLGFIGTISKLKGVEWLIDEFMQIKDIDITLDIAGGGEFELIDFLKKKSEKDERIRFLGRKDPIDFFESIDLSIIPSIGGDSLPGVAFESCAFNVPVIGSNIGGIPEIIKSGVNGVLVESNSKGAIAAAIRHIYNNPGLYKNLVNNTRQSVSKFLDADRVINEYFDVMEKLDI